MLRKTMCVLATCAVCFAATAESKVTSDDEKNMSPPTKVDEWDMEEDFKKIDQQWDSIFAVLENDDYFAIKSDDVSAWSAGQQAGHLALTMNGVGDQIQGLLASPEQNADGELGETGTNLLTSGIIPRGVGQAPDALRPENTSREKLLATLKEAQKKWEALEGKSEEIAECKARAEHPTGMMAANEWVRLAAVHNAHHLKIIRDILKAEGNEKFGEELMEPIEE